MDYGHTWPLVFVMVLNLIGPHRSNVRLASDFVMTKTDDTNDGVCDAGCSLREAIRAANAAPDADAITVPAGVYFLSGRADGEAVATGDLDVSERVMLNGEGAGLKMH